MTLPPHRRRKEEDEERVSGQLAQTTMMAVRKGE
jgi:hypothetical protein